MLLYIKYILKWVIVSMKIVLASKSPRRKELLSLLDLDFEIITADIDETMDSSLPVTDEVARISYQKADAVAGKLDSDTVVISADTIVELDGIIMGKPQNAQEAMNMLSSLSGKSHNVHTAVTVLKGKEHLTRVVTTAVTFRDITTEEITAYIKTQEPMDKAGAYGIQGRASKFVSGIVGDYFNVVGLPVCELSLMLKNFDINI